MSLVRRLYSDELTAGEIRLGLVLRRTVNPNRGVAGQPDWVPAVVLKVSATDRVVKFALPAGRNGYGLQRFGRWAWEPSARAEWKPLSAALFAVPEMAIRCAELELWRRDGRGFRHPAAAWAVAASVLAAIQILLSLDSVFRLFVRRSPPWPAWTRRLLARLGPWSLANPYGLFAVMTTCRPEIEVEGSWDGETWQAYGFKWKPGNLRRPPRFVAPHQPRLDWQMWFAALGSPASAPWFMDFAGRLLEGSPEVLRLLDENPFPDGPPRYLRAMLYDYRFTTPRERRSSGAWWKRELLGTYLPPVGLRRASTEARARGAPA